MIGKPNCRSRRLPSAGFVWFCLEEVPMSAKKYKTEAKGAKLYTEAKDGQYMCLGMPNSRRKG